MKNKKGSAGGQTRAKIQKEQARKRIDDYNKNPNLCLYCNSPIYAPYDKKIKYTTVKKFCSHSCAASYNNLGRIKNGNFVRDYYTYIGSCKLDNFTDEEILSYFKESRTIKEFSEKLGFKQKISYDTKYINDRLDKIGISLNDFRKFGVVENLTKKEIFDRYKQWQTARSTIQKKAREIYNNSSKPKSCIVCGYDKHYEVAHVQSVSEFSDDALISEINNIDNLIALCPNHHWEYDNANLDISKHIKT